MNNPNDTIGNRTRDLPACSAVPQPTAPDTQIATMNYVTAVQVFSKRNTDRLSVTGKCRRTTVLVQAMKPYGGVVVQLPSLLTSKVNGGN
jgi:hypothetical protein